MHKHTRCALIGALGVWVGVSTGCSKQAAVEETEPDPAAAVQESGSVSASKLPGSQEIMAALDRKDYETAVGSLIRAGQSVNNPEHQAQYVVLMDEVKLRLIDEAPFEPKAAEALNILRRVTGGR